MTPICGVCSPDNPDMALSEALSRMLTAMTHADKPVTHTFVDQNAGIAIGYLEQPPPTNDLQHHDLDWTEDRGLVVAMDGSLHGPTSADGAGSAAVAAKLFEQAPADFPNGLDGYFNLTLWDGPNRRLHLASDPLGSKPLFVARIPPAALWSSLQN